MYEVSVKQHFDAAHYLREYQGKCEELHGHRFMVVANMRLKTTNKIGLAYDFSKLKRLLDEVLINYDHCCLNDVEPFKSINPSSENIAATIYQQLGKKLGEFSHTLSSVQVWESPNSCVTYIPDDA